MRNFCRIWRAELQVFACMIAILLVVYHVSILASTRQVTLAKSAMPKKLEKTISTNFTVQDDIRLESYLHPFNLINDFTNFDNVSGADGFVVPNIIHYLRFNKTSFSFVDYCCIRSAYINQRPDFIFFHTNVQAFDGPFWQKMLDEASLSRRIRVLHADVPYSVFDQKLSERWRLYHGSDIVRLQVL